jgi:hypothetical protein
MEDVKKSNKATEIKYTENELAAIAVLEANANGIDNAKTYSELGLTSAVLTSLVKKATDERPMAEGFTRANVCKVDVERTITEVKGFKGYYID